MVEIVSDKYVIDESNNYIYVGSDSDIDTIKNNITKSDEDICVDIGLENNKLYVKYGDQVLKEFKLLSIKLDNYKVIGNIGKSDDITYRLYNGEEEVTSGNISQDDIGLISNYIIKGNVITEIEYLSAADIDKNDIIDINDVIKLVRIFNNDDI